MKKIISGLVLVFYCSTSFAVEKNDFKRAVDVLNYRLTVEWDQKNSAFRDQTIEEFKAKIENLKSKGMSDVEIQNSLLAMVKDPELKKQMMLGNGELSKLKTADEIMNYLLLNQSQFAAQGANYSGRQIVGVTAVGLVFAAFVTLIVVSIVKASKWVCTKYETKEVCTQEKTCSDYDTIYIYDTNGNLTGTGSTCSSYSYNTDCDMVDECVEGYYRD